MLELGPGFGRLISVRVLDSRLFPISTDQYTADEHPESEVSRSRF